MAVLSNREPVSSFHSTQDYSINCNGRPDSSQRGINYLEDHSQRSAAITNPGITGAAGGTKKVRIGRRLADLFIQSGQADVSTFRQWLSSKEALREELESLLFSKNWKELVDEAIELVSEDFRMLSWTEIMNLNEQYVTYSESLYYDIDTSLVWLRKILAFNGIEEATFIKSVNSVMNKTDMKINSIWLFGATNAGKSLICNSIVESARFYANIMEFDERTQFPLNDAPGKRVLLINEPVIADKRIELMKNIMEGQDISINVKHKKGITLPRTPLIIASNKDLWHYCPSEQQAILNRCFTFKCNTMFELINCKKKLHPLIWNILLTNSNPTDHYFHILTAICSHRNWKSCFFEKEPRIEELFNSNINVLSESCDSVHLSVKPSCSLCQLSEKFSNLVDPPNDVTDCVSCGSKTVYLLCSTCIDIIN